MFRQNSSEAPFGPSNRWLPATASSLWEGFVPTLPRLRFSVTATIAPLQVLSRSLFRLANISTAPPHRARATAAGAVRASDRNAVVDCRASGAQHREPRTRPKAPRRSPRYASSLGRGLPSRRRTSQPWRTSSAITDSARNGRRSFTWGVSPSTKSTGSRFCTCMP